jgi:hypothetical protein
MSVIIDGTNGITTPLDVEIQGSTSGSIIIAAPAVAGSNTQTLVAATGTLAPLIAGTAVASTSGTSIDFTSIPSWVKRITVMFNGVSTNGASGIYLQLGTSSGVENTGYAGCGTSTDSASVVTNTFTSGFGVTRNFAAAQTLNGSLTITNISGNVWVVSGVSSLNSAIQYYVSGAKTAAGTLDRVRITTVNGTDTFDAGSINILYE